MAESDSQTGNSYDIVPYESRPFTATHPDSLATKALLFGMKPEPIGHCRVLELGCSSGGNIIPVALNFPGSQFLGLDSSARQIQDGQEQIAALGLKNIELRHLDILDIDESLGQFHYIVAHGVYSWVPELVKEKILASCRNLLAPNGVAYVSYNTFPGWHFWKVIRELMLYHANQFEPLERSREALAILHFLIESLTVKDDAYGTMLKQELDRLRERSDDYIFHEYLEVDNDPLYFWQFVDRAFAHGLQYLGDAEFGLMQPRTLSENGQKLIEATCRGLLETEQYMDFVRHQSFRRTLLCRDDVVLNRRIDHQSLKALSVACSAKADEHVEINNDETQTFRLPSGEFYYSHKPLVKAAFQCLSAIYPRLIRFDELVKIAREELPSDLIQYRGSFESNSKLLGQAILTAYAHDVITLHWQSASFCPELTERPTVSALARYQAKHQYWLTTQRHDTFFLNNFLKLLLELLDGSRNRAQLLEAMEKFLQDGKLAAGDIGTVTEDTPLNVLLAKRLDDELKTFARIAILTQ